MNTVIARSQHREANSFLGEFWFEYRLSSFVFDDYMELVKEGKIHKSKCYQPFRIDLRRVDKPSGQQEFFHPWELWTFKSSAKEAIDDVIGDSNFFNAASLSPLHALAVQKLRLERQRNQLQHERQQLRKTLMAQYDELQRKGNHEWSKAIIKWGENPKRLEAARRRIKAKYGPNLGRLAKEIKELQE